jgi:DNA-binding CsgD family transcriptional regulator
VAEAVERTIDEGERRRLHAALADHLGLRGDGFLDRRARHVVEAGTLVPDDRAVDVLARAGRRALAAGAADPAARWLSAAVVRAGSATVPDLERGRLLVDAADAWERCDELGAALDAATRAVDLLAGEDPSAASRAASRAGRLCWQVGRPEQRRWHDRALELAGSSPERLAVRLELVGALLREGRFDEADAAADLLREDVTGATGPLADAARYRLVQIDVFLHGHGAERLVEEAPPLPVGTSPALVAQVQGGVLEACVLLGRWEEARRRADDALARLGSDARVIGLSWRPIVARVHAAYAAGDWDLASDLVTELAGHTAAGLASSGFWRALLAAVRGRHEEVQAAVDEVRATCDLSSLPLHDGALEVVAAWSDVLAGRPARPSFGRYRPGTFNALSHLAVAGAAGEVLVAAGELAAAGTVADRLAAVGGPETAAGLLARRIRLLAAPAGATEELEAVADGYERLGMPFDAARARLEAAERAGAARGLPPGVAETFAGLRAGPWVDRAAALAGPVRAGAPATDDLLTRREREVAELVAEGLTNAQIAERLIVSIRTVTSHLDHAYTKLGIGSRAALTAYVVRGETADT